jgi:hypothetical protein
MHFGFLNDDQKRKQIGISISMDIVDSLNVGKFIGQFFLLLNTPTAKE